MPRISDIDGVTVKSNRDKDLGRVVEVLFHPDEPRPVGFMVRPPALLLVIARQPRFIPLSRVSRTEDGLLRFDGKRLPSLDTGERALGYSWDDTVVWRGMPVLSETGDSVGAVKDVVISLKRGEVIRMDVSTGVVGDLAVGKLTVSAASIVGFDGSAVIVKEGYNEIEAGGGLAKSAAKGVAATKVHGEIIAKKAYDAGMGAAIAVGRSFKYGTGRRLIDAVKKMTEEPQDE